MKKFIYLLLLFAYLIGTVNGIGYSLYIGEWVTAICVVVLAVMAWPKVKEYYHGLTD